LQGDPEFEDGAEDTTDTGTQTEWKVNFYIMPDDTYEGDYPND